MNIKTSHTHSWNSGTVTTVATCSSNGIKIYTCTICGVTKTEIISGGHGPYKLYRNDSYAGWETYDLNALKTWVKTKAEDPISFNIRCSKCGTVVSRPYYE